MRDEIIAALEQVRDSCNTNELAYLALTGKVELPLRDRLAWALHSRLGDRLVVSREWRRADLALLEGESLLAQVEAKALYAFDVMSPATRGKYVSKLRGDAAKMAGLGPDKPAFLLSFLTHVSGSISPHLARQVVKYAPGVAAANTRHGRGLGELADRQWLSDLQAFNAPSWSTSIGPGTVWDLEVSLGVFLVGPL